MEFSAIKEARGSDANAIKKSTLFLTLPLNDPLQRGYKLMNEPYVEWEKAVQICQNHGARLPVLDTKETIDIVKSCMDNVDLEEFTALEDWDSGSRRVWLGLIYDSSPRNLYGSQPKGKYNTFHRSRNNYPIFLSI